MKFKNLRYELNDGIAILTIDRPKVLNALDLETLREIDVALGAIASDDAVRVLVVTGGGEKAFVAGADISELTSLTPLHARAHARLGQGIFDRLESLGKPSIAAINGYALGGGLELALACTLRVAATNARLGLPEITLGIIPGFGGTQRLPRLIGPGRAMEMILTGKPIKADRALELGLINRLVEADQLMEACRSLAGELAAFSPAILQLAEEAVRRGAEVDLDDGLAFEAAQFGCAVATEDFREGSRAFLEKRKPAFKGR